MQHRPYQGEDFGQIHLFGRGQPTAGSAWALFIRRVIAVDFRLPPPLPFCKRHCPLSVSTAIGTLCTSGTS